MSDGDSTPRRVHNRTPPDVEAEIVSRYDAGESSGRIAVSLGKDRSSVCRVLRRFRLVLRNEGPPRIHHFDERYFSTIDTPDRAYWLGFWGADGNVSDEGKAQLNIKESDRGHLGKFTEAIGYDGPVHRHVNTKPIRGVDVRPTATVSIHLCSVRMVADLARVGIVPRKSLAYRPWGGPEELMSHYWRGMLDGDGCWMLRGNVPFVDLTGSRPAVEGFVELVGRHTGYSARIQDRGRFCSVQVCKRDVVQAIARLVYTGATVWLDRKKAIVDEILSRTWRTRRGKRPAWSASRPSVST